MWIKIIAIVNEWKKNVQMEMNANIINEHEWKQLKQFNC